MNDKVRWGILSTGRIAGAFARALPHSETGVAAAVASRDIKKAETFADEHNIPERYGDYQAMLDAPGIDAVYIAPPHPMHAQWAIRAADAGKHVLCEKPLALNFNDAQAVVEAAIRNDVFLMEAFMYRCNPLTARLCELVRDKVIGEVRIIRATFSFHAGYDLNSRILANRLGGGGITDVGCYATSMARLIAGVALGLPFAQPIDVKAVGHVGAESRCDEWTTAVLSFPNGILAQCATGVQLAQESNVVIYGSTGRLTVPSPWFATGREGGTGQIIIDRNGADSETVEVTGGWLYAIEADTVGHNIDKRQGAWPAMSWEDTLGNMQTLDRWREEIGVRYELELDEGYEMPLDHRPLKVRDDTAMRYVTLAGLDKRVSVLALGAMPYPTFPKAAVAYDEFFARGGNMFDTAYVYSAGASERALGQWLAARENREDCVVLVKGAHSPCCTPEHMASQLAESLERIQMSYADIYCLHRDNPEIPVEEWVDALSAQVDAGSIRIYGGSNWTRERIAAANAYARQAGKHGFSVLSNNFSLARMLDPVWANCIAGSTPEFRRWHEETGFPLLAWSSQAQGFFVPGRAAPGKLDDKDLVRCWYSPENFARLDRARQLAEKKGTSTIAVSLAYVLHQAFPTVALIGPRTLAEMRTSLEALQVELTLDELAWLDGGC